MSSTTLSTIPCESHGGPWNTVDDRIDGDGVHVVPTYGPRHWLTAGCWCHPVEADERGYAPHKLLIHNVAH